MLLIREVMYCKPGKVRAMVDKSLAMATLSEETGMGKMKVMTDFCAERYRTIVSEFEVPSMQAFEEMMTGQGQDPEVGKKYEKLSRGDRSSQIGRTGRQSSIACAESREIPKCRLRPINTRKVVHTQHMR